MLKKLHRPDLGLLLIRVGVGLVFVMHGWAKVTNYEGAVNFLTSVGTPGMIASVLPYFEVAAGALILIGVYTRIVGILLTIDMLFAIILVKWGKGFVGGYAYELIILLSSLALAFTGSGKYAVKKD